MDRAQLTRLPLLSRCPSLGGVLAVPAALLALASAAHATAPQDGRSREEIWYAPTAEDWAKPCLITWQRSWDDAVALALRTGRPLMIAVNMDGEIASEHYAGIRYRQPEIGKLFEPYVSVIASVYRHTPRDHDEEGNRIPCPRFGGVTCGEHIAIEPLLHDQYFEETRVAPRHIMVELDKQEVYDVYYAFDTESVFERITTGITERVLEPYPEPEGDRSLDERIASTDSADRVFVETLYAKGDRAARKDLLQRAEALGSKAPLQILRQALFGLDSELASIARRTLAASENPAAIDLIMEALKVPMPADERLLLVASLDRLGDLDPRGKTLAVVQRGLGSGSETVDPSRWKGSGRTAPVAKERGAVESRLEYAAARLASLPDPEAELEFAEAMLALAVDPRAAISPMAAGAQAGRLQELRFRDALDAALRAEEAGASGWRLDAAISLARWYLGDPVRAQERAARAVKALPAGTETWNAMAVLSLFAKGRRDSIEAASKAGQDFPPEWVSDVHAAYTVLGRHPEASDAHVLQHHDFLKGLGADGPALEALESGLDRFPASPELHGRLRMALLKEGGPLRLEEHYQRLLTAESPRPHTDWYGAHAARIAAEVWRFTPAPESADAAYTQAWAAYERAEALYAAWEDANPEQSDSGLHYRVLCIAGRARLANEKNERGAAVDLILEAFRLRPLSAATRDGVGMSPVAAAFTIRRAAVGEDRLDLAKRLDEGLDALEALDPTLLDLPLNERGGGAGRRRRR